MRSLQMLRLGPPLVTVECVSVFKHSCVNLTGGSPAPPEPEPAPMRESETAAAGGQSLGQLTLAPTAPTPSLARYYQLTNNCSHNNMSSVVTSSDQ